MKQSDKLKELLEEIHKLAEESILYLPIMKYLEHEPQEPLIKDEKIRNALRAWAEANELSVVRVFYIDETETLKLDSGVNLIAISFESEEDYSHLNRETHTITELCGDEE